MAGLGNDEFQRLGKRDLGRYAFETRMPERIAKLLANEGTSNSILGVISNLALLLESEPNTELAYLCTRSAAQVSKLPNEGAHFCGYRNIQMMLLALAGRNETGDSHADMKSSIPEIQQMIENAWDDGYNAHGKVLTGGIQGTRKHIGTSEAEAILLSLSIPCKGKAYVGADAWREILDAVETYFTSSSTRTRPPGSRVIQTDLPPVFLQRPQHSLTIVGFERTKSGKRYLVTFDPAWQAPSRMSEPLAKDNCKGWKARWLLRQYRKSERYLQRFRAFETLEVSSAG
ncbi:hypothetical protein AC578_11163 [Pseudocercospora eumusae]|uniref:UFSP1/2/DUB catalytic domain-containing protein n=1 Tax=Pseudocercospora eumusae TaxID=321146 RepID=A0A139GY78_9PEZI|nr:hypothetical protein AC578_11163 [Pseudocercospora eumusae]